MRPIFHESTRTLSIQMIIISFVLRVHSGHDFHWLQTAHDLAGSSQGGFNDPYIRLYIAPEVDTRKRQTNIHRNEPNPYFDEHFKFPVSQDDLKEKILILQVWHNMFFSNVANMFLPF